MIVTFVNCFIQWFVWRYPRVPFRFAPFCPGLLAFAPSRALACVWRDTPGCHSASLHSALGCWLLPFQGEGSYNRDDTHYNCNAPWRGNLLSAQGRAERHPGLNAKDKNYRPTGATDAKPRAMPSSLEHCRGANRWSSERRGRRFSSTARRGK